MTIVDMPCRHGWGISLGLHVLLLSMLLSFWPAQGPPAPDSFKWNVNVTQSSPPVPSHETPVSTESTEPIERPAERPTVAAKMPSRKVLEQVRPVERQLLVQSRLVNKPALVEHAQVISAAQQAVQPVIETKFVRERAQEMMHSPAEPSFGAVQTVVTQIDVPGAVESREAIELRQSVDRSSHEEDIVETVLRTVQQPSAIVERFETQTEVVHTETVHTDRLAVRHSEPVVSAVHSMGQARAHFGWLKADLMAYIERVKRYPQFALDNKWEGRVVVRAVIWADGNLTDLSVVESSGHEVLDRESLELLKRISPLPLKHQLGAPQVTLRIPINYGIR